MIAIPGNVRVWLATGHTDMRRGFPSLARVSKKPKSYGAKPSVTEDASAVELHFLGLTVALASAIRRQSIRLIRAPARRTEVLALHPERRDPPAVRRRAASLASSGTNFFRSAFATSCCWWAARVCWKLRRLRDRALQSLSKRSHRQPASGHGLRAHAGRADSITCGSVTVRIVDMSGSNSWAARIACDVFLGRGLF